MKKKAPIYVWKIGNNNKPAAESDIDNFANAIHNVDLWSKEGEASHLILHDGANLMGIIDSDGEYRQLHSERGDIKSTDEQDPRQQNTVEGINGKTNQFPNYYGDPYARCYQKIDYSKERGFEIIVGSHDRFVGISAPSIPEIFEITKQMVLKEFEDIKWEPIIAIELQDYATRIYYKHLAEKGNWLIMADDDVLEEDRPFKYTFLV